MFIEFFCQWCSNILPFHVSKNSSHPDGNFCRCLTHGGFTTGISCPRPLGSWKICEKQQPQHTAAFCWGLCTSFTLHSAGLFPTQHPLNDLLTWLEYLLIWGRMICLIFWDDLNYFFCLGRIAINFFGFRLWCCGHPLLRTFGVPESSKLTSDIWGDLEQVEEETHPSLMRPMQLQPQTWPNLGQTWKRGLKWSIDVYCRTSWIILIWELWQQMPGLRNAQWGGDGKKSMSETAGWPMVPTIVFRWTRWGGDTKNIEKRQKRMGKIYGLLEADPIRDEFLRCPLVLVSMLVAVLTIAELAAPLIWVWCSTMGSGGFLGSLPSMTLLRSPPWGGRKLQCWRCCWRSFGFDLAWAWPELPRIRFGMRNTAVNPESWGRETNSYTITITVSVCISNISHGFPWLILSDR